MLFSRLQAEMKQALLNKESLKLLVLRMLVSELNYKKIDLQRELTDEDVIAVIRKAVKQRDESIASYTAGGRSDQVIQETQEKQVLQAYLPQLMSEEDIRKQIVDGRLLDGATDFGQAMRVVSPVFKGKADGGLVAKIVKEWIMSR